MGERIVYRRRPIIVEIHGRETCLELQRGQGITIKNNERKVHKGMLGGDIKSIS